MMGNIGDLFITYAISPKQPFVQSVGVSDYNVIYI